MTGEDDVPGTRELYNVFLGHSGKEPGEWRERDALVWLARHEATGDLGLLACGPGQQWRPPLAQRWWNKEARRTLPAATPAAAEPRVHVPGADVDMAEPRPRTAAAPQ